MAPLSPGLPTTRRLAWALARLLARLLTRLLAWPLARHSSVAPPLQSVRAALQVGMILALGSLVGCSGGLAPGPGPQAHYQTAFPQYDTSGELEQVFASVRRILAEVTYETYLYPLESAPTEADLQDPAFQIAAPDTVVSQQDRAATAIILARRGRRFTLLTVDHGTHFPDTIVDFFPRERPVDGRLPPVRAPERPGEPEPRPEPRRVERISVKTAEVFRIFGLPDLRSFQVLARSPFDDLALLGVEYPAGLEPGEDRVLPIPAGESERLSWGSFVYVMGYPQGYPMVTRGIVSAPGDPVLGSFLVDGLWNRGMSGGAILALRGDGSGVEWVGMARAAAASRETRLRPEHEELEREELGRRYDGPLYLDQVSRIQYGITLSIPMSTIRGFLDRERERLDTLGYSVPRL